MNPRLVDLMAEELKHIDRTDHLFSINSKTSIATHPIPFFGNIETSVVATVGLNPSATEFTIGRWPAELTPTQLASRLQAYFRGSPHRWFETWERALQTFGASYYSNAAHLDVSPRATVNAGSVSERGAFEHMLRVDLPWMVRWLEFAPNLKLILIAGTATKTQYLDEFIERNLPRELARLDGLGKRPPGKGKVRFAKLVVGNRILPVISCSTSPSDRRNPGLLQERMLENSSKIGELVGTRISVR